MARVTVTITDETKEKLIGLAGGERKIGAKLDDLVAEEYARQTVSLEALAERVRQLDQRQSLVSYGDWETLREQLDPDELRSTRGGLPGLAERVRHLELSMLRLTWPLVTLAEAESAEDPVRVRATVAGKSESMENWVYLDDGSTEEPVSVAVNHKWEDLPKSGSRVHVAVWRDDESILRAGFVFKPS